MKKVLQIMFCLFLASSFVGVFAQQNSLQREQVERVEEKIQKFAKENLQNVPQELLNKYKNSFDHDEHGFLFSNLSELEKQEVLDAYKKRYLRNLYFKKFPNDRQAYVPKTTQACENGDFELGPNHFDTTYEGQSAIDNPGGYTSGECDAVPTSGVGNFAWNPVDISNGTAANFELVTMGNDPIMEANGETLNQVKNGTYAVRINASTPCYPNYGIDRLIKPIMLQKSGNQEVRFNYALVSEFPDHFNDNPFFIARALDSNGDELDRICVISNPANNPFFNEIENPESPNCSYTTILWQDWTCGVLNISGNLGDTVTLEFIVADCGAGGHFGYAYVDDICAESCEGGDNFQGSIELNPFDPCEVTFPFDVCANFTLPQLNGDIGNLDETNVSLEILQDGDIVTTLNNGVITGNTVCFEVNPVNFDTQIGGYDFRVNATFDIGNGTQDASDTHTTPGQNNDYIFNNPDCCDIAATVSNIVCYDQGTVDPSDDTWTLDLTVTNSSGSTWNATTPNGDSGGYGNPTTIDMGNISDFSDPFTFLVADDADPSCATNVVVEAPKPCSPTCDLGVEVIIGECSDNGTTSNYSDDTYTVTVTVTGTNGLPWMIKQKLESDGSEVVIYNGTTDVTNLELGPFDVSDGDWTLWVGLSDYSDCLIDTFIAVPNCCNDEPYILPYWQHPDCPEVVCTADQWPIQVLSSDGTPISSAGGVIISWDNLGTPQDENILQDFWYASPLEEWQATITYPNGCEYVITYLEDCCDEDIFIRVLDCPTEGQLQAHKTALEKAMESASANRFAAVGSAEQNTSEAQQAQIQAELDLLREYMEVSASRSDDGCDPCDFPSILIELVDANGDIINVNDYDTFSWSDGGSGSLRVFPLPMLDGPVCFTATNAEYGKICEYQDCFFYECEEECLCDELTLQDFGVSQVNECTYFIGAAAIRNCSNEQVSAEEFSFTINNGAPITSTGNGIYHTFTANGTYDITMTWTVTDIEDCTTTVTESETVVIDCVDDPDPCEAPSRLQFDCRRASMSWSGDPSLTYVVEVNWDDPGCRTCIGRTPTAMRWEVQGTSFQLPYIDRSGCFSWRIGVRCREGIVWSNLECEDCYLRPQEEDPTKPEEDVSGVKTTAKISPNPNDGNMNIEISGRDKTDFTLKVYRFDGILIKTFDNNRIENKLTTITWNGKSVLTPGMYFFVITTDKETITKKVVVK